MEKKVLIALVVLVNMVYVCQAQNAVDRRGLIQILHQFLCGFMRLGQTVFGIGHVNIIVYMALVGGEMPLGNPVCL